MLMLLRWRHIGKMLLITLLVMSCTSCARWREAKAVIAEAESLLVKGVIIKDTAALSGGICTLENLMGRVFAKEGIDENVLSNGKKSRRLLP